jgi:hypothetical protein
MDVGSVTAPYRGPEDHYLYVAHRYAAHSISAGAKIDQ